MWSPIFEEYCTVNKNVYLLVPPLTVCLWTDNSDKNLCPAASKSRHPAPPSTDRVTEGGFLSVKPRHSAVWWIKGSAVCTEIKKEPPVNLIEPAYEKSEDDARSCQSWYLRIVARLSDLSPSGLGIRTTNKSSHPSRKVHFISLQTNDDLCSAT